MITKLDYIITLGFTLQNHIIFLQDSNGTSKQCRLYYIFSLTTDCSNIINASVREVTSDYCLSERTPLPDACYLPSNFSMVWTWMNIVWIELNTYYLYYQLSWISHQQVRSSVIWTSVCNVLPSTSHIHVSWSIFPL